MMPSPADRRAWPALMLIIAVITVAVITGLMVVLGLGDLVVEGMRGLFTLGISYLATAFTFTICINLLMIAIIALLERLPGLQRR
jgi:predicted anti-sigma-YlaC factor YlaD